MWSFLCPPLVSTAFGVQVHGEGCGGKSLFESLILAFFCEEVGVVKRVHVLSGEVRSVATALKVVEEVQEEVQEVKDE